MRRVALWLLLALLVAGAVSGLALLARRQAERAATVYTDGRTIAVPAGKAPLRTILWTPAEPLPGDVNSPADDHQPRVSTDGSTLFFVRGRAGGGADIWWARRTADAWSDPAPLDAINSDADELTPCPTPNGDALVFASDRPAGRGGYDLWISRRDGDTWSTPVWLGDQVNTPHNEYAPGLSPDGLWLWYASNRPDKEPAPPPAPEDAPAVDPFAPPPAPADYDIYRARLIADSASVVSRIEALCSVADDITPAWSPAEDFVYFASDRAPDTGFDLYRARIADGAPLEPEPLGPTINTPRDELDPGVALGGFELLFSIARPAAAPDDPGDLELARSLSREVYPVVDRSRMRLDLSRLWDLFGPWLLWLLLLLLLLLLLIKFRASPVAQGRWRKMSLLARCLMLSMLIHALLLALLGLWRVSAGIGDLLEDDGAMRIRLTSSRAGVETQIAGGFVESPAELADSVSTARAQAQPEPSPATFMRAAADPAPLPAEQAVAQLAPSPQAEDVPPPQSPESVAAADQAEVSTPRAVRSAPVGESVAVEALAMVADPARAGAEPAGAEPSQAAIDPGATRTERAAMAPPIAADAAPTAEVAASISAPASPASPPPSSRVEEGRRVADAERADVQPVADAATPPAPARAIDAGGSPTEFASTTPGATPLTPAPAQPTTLAAGAPTEPVEASRSETVAPPAPSLAATETPRVSPAAEPTARDTPVATAEPSARAGTTPSEPADGATLVQSDPGRTDPGVVALDTPALTDNTPQSTGSPSPTPTAPPPSGALAASGPDAQRAPAAPEPTPSTTPTPDLGQVARAPDAAGAEDAPDSAPVAALAPANNSPAPPTALALDSPADADRVNPTASIAPAPGSAPPLAAVALPLDRGASSDEPAAETIAGASLAPVGDSSRAAIATSESTNQPGRLDPALTPIDPEATPFAPAETAATDAPPPTTLTRLADAAPAPSPRLPEASPDEALSEPFESIAAASAEPRRARLDADVRDATTPGTASIEPARLALDPVAPHDQLADQRDAPPQPALALAAPPAPPAPTPTIPAPTETSDPAPSETASRPAERPTAAPTRARLDTAPAHTELVLLDAPAADAALRPTAAPALPDADAPAEGPALAMDPRPRAAPPRDVPPLPAEPDIYPQRDETVRKELVERGGGSEETEKAVADALAWLARNQSEDGRWSSRGFERIGGPSGDPARYDFDVATTALALLCFFGADHTPIEPGPYQDHVSRALAWLLAQEGAAGEFRAGESMYSQAIATIALCEAFAMTRDPDLLGPIDRAIAFIVGARNRDVGGWRYEPGQPGDTSVLGWMVMAFESARRCGVDIDPAAPDTAAAWLDTVMDPSWPGRYAYRPGMEATRSMTAEGMFVRQLLRAEREDPRQLGAARFVLQDLPRWDDEAPTYQWYYATLALFQHGGAAWDRWNRSMSRELVAAQRADGPAAGSWDPTDRYAQIGGRIYQTAICTLSLEVYYRYLPMYVDEPVAGMGGE